MGICVGCFFGGGVGRGVARKVQRPYKMAPYSCKDWLYGGNPSRHQVFFALPVPRILRLYLDYALVELKRS